MALPHRAEEPRRDELTTLKLTGRVPRTESLEYPMLEPKDCRKITDPAERQLAYTVMWRDRALANARAGERTAVCRRNMRDGALRYRKLLAANGGRMPVAKQ